MDLALIVAFMLSIVVLCTSLLSKAKPKKRRGYEREEIQIQAADVPEFKPTWRETR